MNWGQGITVFLIVFVLFILGLVYMTTRSTFDLEAEDYYAQEIDYQQRIDALSLGAPYSKDFVITEEGDQVIVSLKSDIKVQDGKISFYRANDSSLDRTFDLKFSDGLAAYSKKEFVKGQYEIRIEWMNKGELHAITRKFLMR